MCHDGLIEDFCLPPTDFYVCKCSFDEVVKMKFSQVRCHEEILINHSRHFYSLRLVFLREQAVLRKGWAGAFLIMADGKRNLFSF